MDNARDSRCAYLRVVFVDKKAVTKVKWFKDNGITLRILELPSTLIDFNGQEWIADMVNNVLIEVLTSIADREVKKIDKRRAEGIAAMPIVNGKKVSAKKGTTYGRQPIGLPKDFEKLAKKQKDGKMTVKGIILRKNKGTPTIKWVSLCFFCLEWI